MPQTRIALSLATACAAIVALVFWLTLPGCAAVPCPTEGQPYLPGQSEVKAFNDVAGPVVEAAKPFIPSPFREIVEVVGGGLLAYGGYKKKDVKAKKEVNQAKAAAIEIAKGWQDVLDAGGIQLGQTVTTKYGPMTVAEILADAQGDLAAKLVDEAQGKA